MTSTPANLTDPPEAFATDPTTAPEAAFALLGNKLRMNIVQALFEDPRNPVSFSALRDRVGEALTVEAVHGSRQA